MAIGIAAALGAMTEQAQAERLTFDAGVESRATVTDNAAFQTQGQGVSDEILEISPRIGLRADGKRFRLSGGMGFTALAYLEGTQKNRILPAGDLLANLEAIEKLFFIDAQVQARQTAENAFAPNPNSPSDFNTATAMTYRIAPMFEGRLGGNAQWRLRSDNSWTDVSGNGPNAGKSYVGQHAFRIEHAPVPVGWRLEAGRTVTRFPSSDVPSGTVDSARVAIPYAFSPEFNLGVRAGYEKTNLVIDNNKQVIYGGEMSWHPSTRTDLTGFWERRFFGSGWRASFNYRQPRVAWNIGFSRDVASSAQAFLTLPPTNDVAALLDAAFTTRFPDPAERARLVSDVMARQGLPSSLSAETRLFANQLSLVTTQSASVALLGVRNTIVLSVFNSKSEQFADSAFATLDATGVQNLQQQGAAITFAHQFSSATSMSVKGNYTRPKGIAGNAGLGGSKQRSVSAEVTHQLAPKTSAFGGVRAQSFDSNVPGITSAATEHAAFVGLGHRF